MFKKKIIPVILCGGSGTRLWPLSKESFPKQYINLEDKNKFSLLQNTVNRILCMENIDSPILVCNEKHRFITAEQMREINIKPRLILLEPSGQGTAPAITIAALKAIEKDKDAYLIVLSSDHIINDQKEFIKSIKVGIHTASEGKLVTFGVIPTYPETGYGYIESSHQLEGNLKSYEIKKFIEKPSPKKAKELIKNKNILWNSGIFLLQAKDILEEIKTFEPDIIKNCKKALEKGTFDLDFFRIHSKYFSNCKNISLDKGILEKTKSGVVVPLNVGWQDIGSWDQLWDYSKKDKYGNSCSGKIVLEKSKNCFFKSEQRLIVGIGTKDLVVIETSDSVLVLNKNLSQDIKQVVQKLKKNKFKESIEHPQIYRPWGSFITLVEDENWKVKKIIVKPHQSLSLQMHKKRSEHLIVVNGRAKVEINDKVEFLDINQSTYIPQKTKHRLSNPDKNLLTLIEIQSGTYLGEDDIIRFIDNYGRINNSSH